MKTFKTALALGASILGLAAAPASAATIMLNNLTATWFNAVGGAAVGFSGNGTGSASINWGTPANGPRSGYDFVRQSASISTVVPPTTPFTIGTFTHRNQAINAGSSITGVSLRLLADVVIDGVSQGQKQFTYTFTHEETTNSNPCAYGPTISNNPCPDRVTVASSPSSQTFLVNGVAYTLSFSDFVVNGVGSSSFISPEGGTNSALLRAAVVAAVPEPATWLMMMAGFGLVGAGLRRRRMTPAVAA